MRCRCTCGRILYEDHDAPCPSCGRPTYVRTRYLPVMVQLDGGQPAVEVLPDRAGACPATCQSPHDGEVECWREAHHRGPHVQPVFDWLGRAEPSPLWVWH